MNDAPAGGTLRLIYVTTSYPYDGAGEDFFAPEVRALIGADVDLLVVPRHPSGVVRSEDALVARHYSLFESLVSPSVLWAVCRVIATRPRVLVDAMRLLLQSDSLRNFVYNLAVLPKGIWLGVMAREWQADHIHAQWIGANASLAMFASLVSEVPLSITAHRGDIVLRNLLTQKCDFATFVRFISEDGVRLAEASGCAPVRQKATVVKLGVECPAMPPRARPIASQLRVCCPARFLEVKGHRYLVAALRCLVEQGIDARLSFAGDGPLRGEIHGLVLQAELSSRVRFLGQVSHADLLGMYARHEFDVVVLPSVDLGGGEHEGIPVALMEAMAAGIPTVSTRTGGIGELLGDGAGVLVEQKNAAALAGAIAALATNEKLRAEIIEAGWRRVHDEYDASVTARQLIKKIAATIVTSVPRHTDQDEAAQLRSLEATTLREYRVLRPASIRNKVLVVDFGVGNVASICNMFRRLGIPASSSSDPTAIAEAPRLVLPGVGAFDAGMGKLSDSGLVPLLRKLVLDERRPVLGICLGMQLFADGSEEGDVAGLGWITGRVRRFDPEGALGLRVPHMGWNQLSATRSHDLLRGLDPADRFYFVHSYHFEVAQANDVLAYTEYGGPFVSAVARGNIVGVQFHPEKSHQFGSRILRNFAEMA